jgi:hypothetical protein
VDCVLRRLLALVAVLGLLGGCGTASFSNAFAVLVPSTQDVSVFDSQMGESAEWAEKTMAEAAPGSPYTTQVPALDTKFVGDDSPPTSLRVGVYLPDRTPTGYYSLILNDVVAGSVEAELPFVAWYSPDPVPPQPPLPVTLDIAPGPNGWLVNITVREEA